MTADPQTTISNYTVWTVGGGAPIQACFTVFRDHAAALEHIGQREMEAIQCGYSGLEVRQHPMAARFIVAVADHAFEDYLGFDARVLARHGHYAVIGSPVEHSDSWQAPRLASGRLLATSGKLSHDTLAAAEADALRQDAYWCYTHPRDLDVCDDLERIGLMFVLEPLAVENSYTMGIVHGAHATATLDPRDRAMAVTLATGNTDLGVVYARAFRAGRRQRATTDTSAQAEVQA